jgi:uncharacterized protein
VNAYYVYALKDTRKRPASPFYIGKGTGTRATDHLANPDDTRKGHRIQEILKSKHKILVSILADDLTEVQAIKLEADLISAFGTEETGGILTNSVVPSGTAKPRSLSINIPVGLPEKAQLGLDLLKSSVLELARANPEGVSNSEVTKAFGLQSDYLGGSKDYLAWSILGVLMKEGKMKRGERRGTSLRFDLWYR